MGNLQPPAAGRFFAAQVGVETKPEPSFIPVRALISGICGFVGSIIARHLLEEREGLEIIGLDNLSRPGSHLNLAPLRALGIKLRHADVRLPSDVESLPSVAWVIDAAANPSVLAGVVGETTSRQIVQHNLDGTVNLLEVAKQNKATFTLLSTSRVYSIRLLADIPVEETNSAFSLAPNASAIAGLSAQGIAEHFPTTPPISLYGATKLASEILALEYGSAFDFPIWINRCGVLAGAGQFGRPDQGIFAYWIHAYLRNQPLRYIGFNGSGYQARDCLHPRDLIPVLLKQLNCAKRSKPQIVNFGGGLSHTMSLRQLSRWCADRFGERTIEASTTRRPFDLPWVVMDCRLAEETWGWRPGSDLETILDEIARHAESHPDWLKISAAYD